MTTDGSMCPVCGYNGLLSAAWDDDSPSDEICPCCGTQFGYDDFATTADARVARHRDLREEWVASGFPWFSTTRLRPHAWDPVEQLRTLDGTDR